MHEKSEHDWTNHPTHFNVLKKYSYWNRSIQLIKEKHNCRFIIAFHIVMLALRTDVPIRMRRTIAIDVRMATAIIKVIKTATPRR